MLCAWIAAGYAVSESAAGERTDNATRRADPKKAEQLYRVMTPLLRAMDPPRGPADVSIGLIDDKEINAAMPAAAGSMSPPVCSNVPTKGNCAASWPTTISVT